MSDETKKQSTADKVRPLVEQLERDAENISAPLLAHQSFKQLLARFWQSVQSVDVTADTKNTDVKN